MSQTNQRNSSIELLRIVATIMVVATHFSVWYVPLEDFSFTVPNLCRVSVEAFCIVCVNCFLIISGWYGIRLKFKSVWKLAEQVFLVVFPFYIISCLLGKDTFSVNHITENMMVFSFPNYFVQDYLMLMFLSPVLNAFVEKYRANMLKWVLMFAFILFWMCCIRQKNDLLFMHYGQTLIHFVMIYLMARTAAEYRDVIMKKKASFYFAIYGLCSVVLVVMAFLKVRWWFYFDNPVLLVSSFCLFFAFLNLTFQSSVVNFLAGSSFAAFLIHTTQPALDVFRDWDKQLFAEYEFPVYFLLMWVSVFAVYLGSVMYDRLVRCTLLAPVSKVIYDKITSLGFMQKNLLEK